MVDKKKKRKTISFSKIKDITRIDAQTFYHPSSDPDKEPYMVFNSVNRGWMCDCMNFVLNLKDSNDVAQYQCKHIKKIKEKYGI